MCGAAAVHRGSPHRRVDHRRRSGDPSRRVLRAAAATDAGRGHRAPRCGRALLGVPGSDTAGPLATALGRLEEALGARGGLAVDVGGSDHVEALQDAATAHEQVEIDYYSFARDEMSTRDRPVAECSTRSGRGTSRRGATRPERSGSSASTACAGCASPVTTSTRRRGPKTAGRGCVLTERDDPRVTLWLGPEAAWVVEATPGVGRAPPGRRPPDRHGDQRAGLAGTAARSPSVPTPASRARKPSVVSPPRRRCVSAPLRGIVKAASRLAVDLRGCGSGAADLVTDDLDQNAVGTEEPAPWTTTRPATSPATSPATNPLAGPTTPSRRQTVSRTAHRVDTAHRRRGRHRHRHQDYSCSRPSTSRRRRWSPPSRWGPRLVNNPATTSTTCTAATSSCSPPPNKEWHKANIDDLVKRVIGLPGETVTQCDGEKVCIDGKVLDESYLPKGTPSIFPSTLPKLGDGTDVCVPDSPEGGCKVPAGMIFVMGDNRTNSEDLTGQRPGQAVEHRGPRVGAHLATRAHRPALVRRRLIAATRRPPRPCGRRGRSTRRRRRGAASRGSVAPPARPTRHRHAEAPVERHDTPVQSVRSCSPRGCPTPPRAPRGARVGRRASSPHGVHEVGRRRPAPRCSSSIRLAEQSQSRSVAPTASAMSTIFSPAFGLYTSSESSKSVPRTS